MAYAFMHNVLARFGSCAEVITDNGEEFSAEFDALLKECLIDHRHTSASHPPANGLAERAVQSVKRALRKMTSDPARAAEHWDEQIPWILLGYRASIQESTKHSPMQLLYARNPVIPPATVEKLAEPIDFDDPAKAGDALLQRSEYLKQAGVMVDNYLRIAQHRDTLRYSRVRGGAYVRKSMKFQVGDFVYVKEHGPTSLDPRARPYILRVVGIKPSGVLELMGRCGTVIMRHNTSCAPCHLPNIDSSIDPTLARPIKDLPCSKCGDPGRPESMLLCDACNSGWHLQCLEPPLREPPRGHWFCPVCVLEIESLPPNQVTAPPTVQPRRFTTRPPYATTADAGRYDSRLVRKPGRGNAHTVQGMARYLGPDQGKRCYEVSFQDGTTQRFTAEAIESLLVTTSSMAAAQKPATSISDLPADWTMSTYESARKCLTSLAPGHWTEGHIIGFMMQATMFAHDPAPAYSPSDVQSCVSVLFESVRAPSQCVDPWPVQNAAMHNALQARGVRVLPIHEDAIQAFNPVTYRTLQSGGKLDWIIGSPSPYVTDLVLFLSSLFVPVCVALLVPSTYITQAPTGRQNAVSKLQQQGRLCTVMCVSGEHQIVASTWVLVFGSAQVRDRYLQSNARVEVRGTASFD